MRLIHYFKAAFFIIVVNSCNVTKPLPVKVNQILIFPVITNVGIVNNGNQLEMDSLLSAKVEKEIVTQVKKTIPENVAITGFSASGTQLKEITDAYTYIIKRATGQEQKVRIEKIPRILLQILDSTGLDYGLCIIEEGFLRTKKNQIDQTMIARGINFFSLGLLAYIEANQSGSVIVCFIIDRKNKKIHFYEKSSWGRRDPTEQIVIKSQIYHLLMSYFQNER